MTYTDMYTNKRYCQFTKYHSIDIGSYKIHNFYAKIL